MKLSDYVIKFIEDLGVKNVFLISGGGCIHLVDSLGKSKKIKYICNLHEQGAGICADAYSQYTNNIGVALVTTGPGGTNIVTAIAGSWLDSIPVLVIAGQVQTQDRSIGKGTRQFGFQEIDLISIVKPITKYAITITHADDIKFILEKAVLLAKSGRPGPVLIEIPLDIQAKEIDENQLGGYEVDIYHPLEITYRDTISNIINDLNKAKRPIILVGNGVRLSGGIHEFYNFIDKTQIPVLTTWKALDLLEEDHPLYVGRPGVFGQRGANFNQQNSDFILCIGARLDHGQIAYQQKYFAREATKVIVDIDINELNKFNIGTYKINEDAKWFLSMLNNRINEINPCPKNWLNHCKETYKKYPVATADCFENKGFVNLYAFMDRLSEYLPPNSLIIPGSSGTCSEVTMQAIKIKKGMRIFNTEGLGPMGFGVPASIGGCIASNNKETICIDGDGGFFMNIQELELVHRFNLPIKFFVLNNDGYGAIKTTQKTYFNGVFTASDPSSGVTLPDISLTANAYQIPYTIMLDNDELEVKLKEVLNTKGPIICEVMMDKNHETLPRTSAYKKPDGSFAMLPMEDMKPFLPREEFEKNMIVKIVDKEE